MLECLGSDGDGKDRSTGVLLTAGYAWKDTLFPGYYNEIAFGFEPLGPVSGDGNGFLLRALGHFNPKCSITNPGQTTYTLPVNSFTPMDDFISLLCYMFQLKSIMVPALCLSQEST